MLFIVPNKSKFFFLIPRIAFNRNKVSNTDNPSFTPCRKSRTLVLMLSQANILKLCFNLLHFCFNCFFYNFCVNKQMSYPLYLQNSRCLRITTNSTKLTHRFKRSSSSSSTAAAPHFQNNSCSEDHGSQSNPTSLCSANCYFLPVCLFTISIVISFLLQSLQLLQYKDFTPRERYF